MTAVPITEELKMVARTSLVLLGAYVLQLGVIDDLSLFSVHGDLLLAVVVGSAVAWGAERGAVVGFFAGCLADLALGSRFGVSGLAWGLTGFGIGVVSETLARRSAVLDAVLMFAGGLIGTFAYAIVGALFGAATLGEDNLGVIIVMVGAWNVVFSPLIVPLARWAGDQPDLRPAR